MNNLLDKLQLWIDTNLILATYYFATMCAIVLIISLVAILNRWLSQKEEAAALERARKYGEAYFKQVEAYYQRKGSVV